VRIDLGERELVGQLLEGLAVEGQLLVQSALVILCREKELIGAEVARDAEPARHLVVVKDVGDAHLEKAVDPGVEEPAPTREPLVGAVDEHVVELRGHILHAESHVIVALRGQLELH